MSQAIIQVVTLSIITYTVCSLPLQEQNTFLLTVLAKRHPSAPRHLILTTSGSGMDAERASSQAKASDVQPLLMQTSMALQKSQVEMQAFSFWPLIIISITLCACVVLVTAFVVATSQTDEAVADRLMQDGKILKPNPQVPELHAQMTGSSHGRPHMDLTSLIAQVVPRGGRVNFMASLVVPAEHRLHITMPNVMSDVQQETTFNVVSANPDCESSPIVQVVVSEQKCLYGTGPSISLQTLDGGNLGLLSTEGLYGEDPSSTLKLITTFGNEFGSLQNLPVSNTYVLMHHGKTAFHTTGDISKGSMTINNLDGCLAASVTADAQDMLNVEVEPEIDFGLIVLIVLGIIKMERHKSANNIVVIT